MKKFIVIALLISVSFCACKSYSRYSIDQQPQISIDTRMLGTWKAIEDTDAKNCVVVQCYRDLFHKSGPSFADSVKNAGNYYITYLNRHGRNPLYQQFEAFLSKVQNAYFLNFHYDNATWEDTTEYGFVLVKFIRINPTYDTVITALVADTSLKKITCSASLRKRISAHLNNPAFYSDTLHFYKVNNVHRSLEEARDNANR